MNRLQQDAADTLHAYEAQQRFRQSERERWARAQPPKIVGYWAPTITEQERQEREQQIAAGVIPF
jgi:hypothetical protein